MADLSLNDLRDVLLVRAFEDSAPALVTPAEGASATAEARAALAPRGEVEPAALVVRRARALRGLLERERPEVARVAALARGRALPAALLLPLAFLLGVAVDRLGPAGRVDLLSFPLLGLLAWNLAVYLALAAGGLRGSSARVAEGEASRSAAGGGLAALAAWLLDPARPWRGGSAAQDASVVAALQRFWRDWMRLTRPLHAARLRGALHLGALGVAAGAVAGLYLRGLVLHYEASWGSTFLGPAEVRAFLAAVFAPAAGLLGREVPDLAAIEALRGPDGAGEAALWIHYYAVTAGLVVGLPRAALALAERRRAARLGEALPLDLEGDAYFLRLAAADLGAGRRAAVETYSYEPGARAAEGLSELLHDALGGRVEVARLGPVEYGGEPAPPGADGEAGELCRVLVFSLAQTPEREVHGELVAGLLRAAAGAPGRRSLLVVLDRGPLEERLGRDPDAAARLERRERAWRGVLEEVGLAAVAVLLDGGVDAAAVEAARSALRRVTEGAA